MKTIVKGSRKKKWKPRFFSTPNPIADYMERNGIPIRKFAWNMGFTEQCLRYWMAGRNSPSVKSRIEIAKTMKIKLARLNSRWKVWEQSEIKEAK
jgi:hypothetical protein